MDKRLCQPAGLLPIREPRLSAEGWMFGGWRWCTESEAVLLVRGIPSIHPSNHPTIHHDIAPREGIMNVRVVERLRAPHRHYLERKGS